MHISQLFHLLLLLQLLLIPVLALHADSNSAVRLADPNTNGRIVSLVDTKRRRRGTFLKAVAGGAALGGGAALLYKAFKGRKNSG